MKATSTLRNRRTSKAGNRVSPVWAHTTLAARKRKSAPAKGSPSRSRRRGGSLPPACAPARLPLVELVVAHRVEVEADHVHGLDGGLVVEEGGEQRAGSDEVAGRHHHRVVVGPLELADVGGQVLGPARRHAGEQPRRLQVAMEVVDGEQLHLDRCPGGNGLAGAAEPAGASQAAMAEAVRAAMAHATNLRRRDRLVTVLVAAIEPPDAVLLPPPWLGDPGGRRLAGGGPGAERIPKFLGEQGRHRGSAVVPHGRGHPQYRDERPL